MRAIKKRKGRFKVGDWVSIRYRINPALAQMVEGSGPLENKRCSHIYGVRIEGLWSEPYMLLVTEDNLELASPLDREAIIAFLQQGGLVHILRSNLGDGDKPPKAWLTYSNSGGVTHTFEAHQGVIGGVAVPYFALHERKVFTGKKDKVLNFLASFGLDRQEAEEVLAAVGTAP